MKSSDFINPNYHLSFGAKDSFRILCLSDNHGGKGYEKEKTAIYMNELLDKSNPDLVLLLGDNAGPGVVHIENTDELREMLDTLVEPIEKRKIPWGHVFGNHDDNYGVKNEEAQKVYETYPHNVSCHNEAVSGSSDYLIPVYDGEGNLVFNVFAFDSHRGMDGFKEDFSLPKEMNTELKNHGEVDIGERGTDVKQVVWYYTLSEQIEKEQGKKIPAMGVMHVPLQEFAWCSFNKGATGFHGYQGEAVSGQGMNSGLFRAALERGDIKTFCFGHDHENKCVATYCGITLCNDGFLSCHSSHNPETLGGRVFDVNINDPWNVKTEFVGATIILDK